MYRADVSPSADQSYFRRTAAHTKKVNLFQKVYRGGIRF